MRSTQTKQANSQDATDSTTTREAAASRRNPIPLADQETRPLIPRDEGPGASAAGDAIGVAHPFRQAAFAPILAGVLGAEHLAGARYRVDLVRVARVQGHAHHRRVGLDVVVEALPGLADILALVDRAVGRARRRAQRRVH